MAPLLEDKSINGLPSTLEMAFEADNEWMPRIETIDRYPYAVAYYTSFTGSSSTTHPSITGIDRVVTEQDGRVVVGMPRELEATSGPYAAGYFALLNTLLVASHSLGWPEAADVEDAMNRD